MKYSEEDYLKDRVDDQIDWYDRRSQSNQKWYKWLRLIEIIAAASIPFVAGYMSDSALWPKVIAGSLGLIVAIITAIVGLYNFQEHWVEYRTTCESLKHEKFLYLTKTEPYNIEEPFPLFVKRVESLISTENTKWSQHVRSQKKEEKDG